MAKRKKKRKPRGPFYKLNHYIQAPEVRVVDEAGKQVGVLPLGKALKQAQEKGLDLVEVAPRAKPPVCKIVDFKKFKFLEAKKKKAEKKKTKQVEIKEVRLTPFIAENDFNFRIARAEEFLKDGDKVKVSIFFRGRQIAKKEFGYDQLKKAVEALGVVSQVEAEPKFVGRRLEMTLSPVKGQPVSKKQATAKPKEKPNAKAKEKNQTKDQKVDQKKV